MEKTVAVTVTIGDRRITLEGPEDFVRGEVRRFAFSVEADARPAPAVDGQRAALTERDLVAQKRPRNQSETVAVLGFCLTENGHAEFTEADIKRAYVRAGVRPPKVISQALRDARNKFDLIDAGTKRGTYRLSAHGDRTVRFDLPAGE
ncbi:MAG: hypothetical protein DMG59_14230 [Acidobacteria bacterium]|nr:MAG: hypothetical protein DMG59_14230 [Acidobacteriota bacterium]